MQDNETEEDFVISKTERKREAKTILDTAQYLCSLSKNMLASLPLTEELLESIYKTQSIRSHVARKRQVQFLAKKMRHADLGPLLEALDPDSTTNRQKAASLQRSERWRDYLIATGQDGLSALPEACLHQAAQPLRQLLRQIEKTPSGSRSKKLFKLLLDCDSQGLISAMPPPIE